MNANKIIFSQKKICFQDFPVGTIFEADRDIFIKIDSEGISEEIGFARYEGECIVDIETLPNAVKLADGTVAYFSLDKEVAAIYPSATIRID
ncbi:MAG: hypothetical protein UHU19_17775 [Lachnospiraceae bacterium]|nr:hypothetical protein [Lachnospiraceae bacterium]